MAVDLGFIDKSNKLLESRFFPSKIGGKPAWLNLKDIPPTEELICTTCNTALSFLCQLYCPVNDKRTAFHRTIFVFLCVSKECFHPNSNSNFTVYRNQLPRHNPYYPNTPPVEDLKWRPDITLDKFGTQACAVCGIRSKYRCDASSKSFCCTNHEQLHKNSSAFNLLPEYGLSIEPEEGSECESYSEESEVDEVEDVDITQPESRFAELRKIASAQDDPTVEQIFSECSEKVKDEVFTNFKSCIESQPEQVIRYDRGGEPLWISGEHIPIENDVPKCEYCGEKRTFEFQILPQLLNYLNLDEENDYSAGFFDWGTLAIYTCQESCDTGSTYKKEFLWKQDILS